MYKFITILVRILMVLMRKQIINKENLQYTHDCLICANHISANDPPMIGSIIKHKINYLAKAELFKGRIMNWIMLSINSIPVRRGRMDRKALRLVEERLSSGESVLVFPEGTRKATRVKPGTGKFALEMKKDILPIYIENSDDMLGCILGKKRLTFVIGERIKFENFAELELTKENYQYVSDYVMEKIYELRDRD